MRLPFLGPHNFPYQCRHFVQNFDKCNGKKAHPNFRNVQTVRFRSARIVSQRAPCIRTSLDDCEGMEQVRSVTCLYFNSCVGVERWSWNVQVQQT